MAPSAIPPAVGRRFYDPCMAAPRRDTRGIVDAAELFSRVTFRRHEPAAPLRPYLEHYWLIDWDLPEPYASHVVPHPSVNVVFQQHGDEAPWGEVAGIGLALFTQKLQGRGRVCGIQFRPAASAPSRPATGGALDRPPRPAARGVPRPGSRGRPHPDAERDRVTALDAFLLGLGRAPTRRPISP